MLSREQIETQCRSELCRLIEYVGSQACLAAQLGVSRQVVSNWASRGKISPRMAAEVERKTNGLFLRRELRPDVVSWEDHV